MEFILYKTKSMALAIKIIVVILLVLVGLITYTYVKYRKLLLNKKIEYSNKFVTLTDSNFEAFIKKGVSIVDFWADWCQPCKIQSLIINELAEENETEVKFANLDVEKNKKTSIKLNIRNIPTLIFFKNGKEIVRLIGIKNKKQIIQEIEKLL